MFFKKKSGCLDLLFRRITKVGVQQQLFHMGSLPSTSVTFRIEMNTSVQTKDRQGGISTLFAKEAGVIYGKQMILFHYKHPQNSYIQFLQIDLKFSSTQRKSFFHYIPICGTQCEWSSSLNSSPPKTSSFFRCQYKSHFPAYLSYTKP